MDWLTVGRGLRGETFLGVGSVLVGRVNRGTKQAQSERDESKTCLSSVTCFRSFRASSISHTHQLDSSSAFLRCSWCSFTAIRRILSALALSIVVPVVFALPHNPFTEKGQHPDRRPLFLDYKKDWVPYFITCRCLLFVSCQTRLSILRISHKSCSHLLCAARARLAAPLSVPTIDGHPGSRFLITHARSLSNHPFISSKNHAIQPPTPLSSFGRFLGGLISWGLKLN